MPFTFAPGATSKTVYVKLRDATTALGKTGLAFGSAGARASYTRPGAIAVDITLATLASASASWSSGGFVEVEATKCPGLYRLDVPNAVLAANAEFAIVSIGFTGVLDEDVFVNLDTRTLTISAKTDNLPSDPADESALEAAITAATSPLATTANLAVVAAYVDTEVAAIKAKTDQLTFTTPNSVDATATLAAASIRSAIGMASADLDTQLDAILAASGGSGSGSVSFVVTINDDMATPLDGAEVWVSTDEAGSNVIAGALNTDAMGQATFLLDPGSYYLFVAHSGYNRTNPTSFTVS